MNYQSSKTEGTDALERDDDVESPDELNVPWASAGTSIAGRLRAARKDLLDLGMRNSLLNYRVLRARGVEIVDELPVEVFRILVRQGKQMSFLAAVNDATADISAQPEESETESIAARHVDLCLQTSVSSVQLQSRLLATYYAAHGSIEEQGINTLFLALGMLEWREAEHSTELRHAPLILIPVQLERSNAAERFHIRYSGEDLDTNLSLQERLKNEFHITLPDLPPLEDLDVAQYFEEVARATASQQDWVIDQSAIVLGFFSFAKLLMFKDLAPEMWPEDANPSEHATIQALLGDGFRESSSRYNDEENLDQYVLPAQARTVLDADSTQSLAILDANDGRNLVIQGPPGTGKSQTITNIIAEAIAHGKTVLFVAEKMAALEVVKRRLDRVNLGDACLELHSHNTQKKALLQELARTLDLGKPRLEEVEGDRARLTETRDRLNEYAEQMNLPIGESGVTPHEALGQVVAMQRSNHDALRRLNISGVASWKGQLFRRHEERVEELCLRLKEVGVPRDHPFWGSNRSTFLPTEHNVLRELVVTAQRATTDLMEVGDALAELRGKEAPAYWGDVEELFPKPWQLWRKLFGKDKKARFAARTALTAHEDSINKLLDFLDLDEQAKFGEAGPLTDQTFVNQQQTLASWNEAVHTLQDLVDFTQVATVCRTEDLGAVVDVAEEWPRAVSHLSTAFRYTWFVSLLERAYKERPALAQFNRESHEQSVENFRTLDTRITQYNSAQLAFSHWEKLPRHDGGGQLAVLKREFEKKARHMPVRQLMLKAGKPIQALKPVFMMSPLSIANYLPPGSIDFDLVIFDEASQVKPVDAFGALLRGKQAIVVGDSRQLPPTSFFDSLTKGEEVDEENTTADIESVLGLFSAQLAAERMLRWHYRSRHESLIAVSNHAFYHDKLVVFPSPDAAREKSGLLYHHLEQSSYDRGRTRTNPVEARAVALAVMEHARTQPHLSLGVAAFSMTQMQAIQDELELLRRQNTSLEEFFSSAHPHERFFIKNLESIQGDERDVILISVGYGRTADGYLAMNFGPLNGDGGERRLNVLITRARVRCEVFTNLTSDDIAADGKGGGVRALKLFLKYAQTGILDVPVDTGLDADSPFEEAVLFELEAKEYLVKKQVGSAGFRIDLAVVDPHRPGRYLLGIECDGATYHSARSARDRDRLRQEVLENLGWRIHRIWSTDWFRNPQRELARLLAAIEEAQKSPPDTNVTSKQANFSAHVSDVMRDEMNDPVRLITPAPPYKRADLRINTYGSELHTVYQSNLMKWVVEVVQAESPVHPTEVARRIVDAAGVKRIGNRIEVAINAACERAVAQGDIRRSGGFLWAGAMKQPTVRDRSGLPPSSRKIELVAPEEVAVAVEKVVSDAYGIHADEIVPAVARLFGFGRTSEDLRASVKEAIVQMLEKRWLVQQGDYIAIGLAG
ncbi:MAG: hypothetical protein NVSMB52_06670 [Chloroflexota bacterium]